MRQYRRDGGKTPYSREELIVFLRDFMIEERRAPTSRDADRGTLGLPTVDAYEREFGSWTEALEAAGLPVSSRGGHNKKLHKESQPASGRPTGRLRPSKG